MFVRATERIGVFRFVSTLTDFESRDYRRQGHVVVV
jgi:hypothetical protein